MCWNQQGWPLLWNGCIWGTKGTLHYKEFVYIVHHNSVDFLLWERIFKYLPFIGCIEIDVNPHWFQTWFFFFLMNAEWAELKVLTFTDFENSFSVCVWRANSWTIPPNLMKLSARQWNPKKKKKKMICLFLDIFFYLSFFGWYW